VNLAIESGVRLMGENRAQEFWRNTEASTGRVSIHFIARCKTNKVRQIADMVDMIQSLDSARACAVIDRQCASWQGDDVLIEVNIGGEESKAGVSGQGFWSWRRTQPLAHL
jgi:uncharacterized pyridoxal phosphate-containing UPF0001 family protein